MSKKLMTEKLIPFDIEKAKAGWPVVTGEGNPIRIICWDKIGKQPLVGLMTYKIEGNIDYEGASFYTMNGKFFDDKDEDHLDLFLLPKSKTLWVNVYNEYAHDTIKTSYAFPSRERALESVDWSDYIGTFPIEISE